MPANNKCLHLICLKKYYYRGDNRVRTDDLLVANQALSQLSYIPGIFSTIQ